MVSLTKISKDNPKWSLDEFVEVTNQLLPRYLPIAKGNTRIREDINPRLVRHYTSQGMLDEPLKAGKYAVYTYRHLLQLLVVRRLLSEGIGASAIDHLVIQKSNVELENLLAGGVQLEITPANPSLSYLKPQKARSSAVELPTDEGEEEAIAPETATPSEPSQWLRVEVVAGLELQSRSDFVVPATPEEQDLLRDRLWQVLESLST
jgi:DNA-binding transcriptional MerR regulator